MRFSLALLAVLSVAAGPKTGAPTLEDLQNALAEGKVSDAHHLGEQYMKAHPDDADAAYLYASTCMSMGLFDQGNAALDAAMRSHPKDAALHGARADIAALRGDDATARREVTLALALDPQQLDALEVKKQYDVLDHYTQHVAPKVAPGSPADTVATMLGKLASDAPASEIAPMIDPGILANAPAALPRGEAAMQEIVSGAISAARMQFAAGNYDFVAYEVQPDALLIENRFTPERVEMMKKLFADPQGQQMLDDETRQIFQGLDAADRDATFDRLVGSRRLALTEMQVPVVKSGDAYVIADFKLNGMSVRDQLLPMLPHLMDTTGMDTTGLGGGGISYTPPSNYDYSPRSHFPTSALIGIIAGIAALIGAMVRRR